MITIPQNVTNPARLLACVVVLLGASSILAGCSASNPGSSSSGASTPLATTYTLTVNSYDPTAGVTVKASPADNAAIGIVTTAVGLSAPKLTYATNTTVTLTAPTSSTATVAATATTPAASYTETFRYWTGCSSSVGASCTVTMNTAQTVTAVYQPAVTVSLNPSSLNAAVGSGQQFYATVNPSTNAQVVTNGGVTYTLTSPAGSSLSPGTISSSGVYQTPYPAPPSVTLTATSLQDPFASASAVITIAPINPGNGPTLAVNTATVTHPISPLIYGVNQFNSSPALQQALPLPLDRWGGDAATRYNYLLDVTNSAADYYFETNPNSNTAYPSISQVNSQIAQDRQYGSASMITVPMIGYTTKRQRSCGYSVAKYGAQTKVDPYNTDCGTGTLSATNKAITGNDPTDTSTAITQTFAGNWVTYLSGKYGTAATGGVKIYELDNEPEFWSGVHSDVHPQRVTYNELVSKSVAYATAIKTADATAAVAGPVISGFGQYFYSDADVWAGYGTGPCYCYNAYALTSSSSDYQTHGSVYLLPYYLQQMKAASTTAGYRLLDYLDLHGYFAASGANFNPAGDTALQTARVNSTRAFWDPTYTDPNYTDPSKVANTASAIPVKLIPFMQNLVATNYPGTKIAITEYNFGALESINGAIAQADVLGLFGSYGVDMATIWSPPDPATQVPGVNAFKFFLNYDGQGSTFGDQSLAATTSNQGLLSIYAAQRSKDNMLTVLVINKSYGDLTSTVALKTAATSANVYSYSNANLTAITKLSNATVTPGTNGGNAGVTLTFPQQSITLLVMSK